MKGLDSSGVILSSHFSEINHQSKQVRVSFNQNIESSTNNERYEYTFSAYLEVRNCLCHSNDNHRDVVI